MNTATQGKSHAPGPWVARRDTVGWRIETMFGVHVAQVASNGKTHDEANARLIAAAPELLQEAQMQRVWIEIARKRGMAAADCELDANLHWTTDKPHAVIAKAEWENDAEHR
jgi:hypothetical protein